MSAISMIFKLLYWYISTVDKKKEVIFMNYGYHHEDEVIELHPADEINRYSIQLYHRLAKMGELEGKSLMEVGSGRGGGLSYVFRTFKPLKALGIDLNNTAVKFGNTHYNLDGLSFQQGDAQKLNVPSENFDVIMNVESSHRYPEVKLFLDEVYRCLKPGGKFLYTDFREKHEMEELLHLLSSYDYVKFDEQLINKEVVNSLDKDSERRVELVERLAPPFLKKYIHDFAGSKGSPTYNDFASEQKVYFVFCFQKKE